MSIKKTLKRMRRWASTWRRLRAPKVFAGFTLAAFDELADSADDAQYEISRAEARLRAAMARAEAADALAMDAMCRITCAVRADPEEGHNGEFYEALGFGPRGKRKKRWEREIAPAIPALGDSNEVAASSTAEPKAAAGVARGDRSKREDK
jgi:hypothetical protein